MTGKRETREEEAMRRLNEATLESFRRPGRGPGNVRIVVEDRPDGRREVDVESDPPRRP